MATGTVADPFIQDPDATLDYLVDWSKWLPQGDTITASTFTPQAGGVTVETSSYTTTTTRVWISGGTPNGKYRVVNHITTAGGRQTEITIVFQIKEQ